MSEHSLLIRGGTVIDGTGQAQTGGPCRVLRFVGIAGPEVAAA